MRLRFLMFILAIPLSVLIFAGCRNLQGMTIYTLERIADAPFKHPATRPATQR